MPDYTITNTGNVGTIKTTNFRESDNMTLIIGSLSEIRENIFNHADYVMLHLLDQNTVPHRPSSAFENVNGLTILVPEEILEDFRLQFGTDGRTINPIYSILSSYIK